MSDKTAILDKLEEYEKTGHYPGAVEDIYALIHHAADLEEEIDDLKEAAVPRTVEGDGSDLPAGTVVIDRGGHPLMKADDEWNIARFDDYTPSLTENNRAPYTIVWTPKENTNE
jgi:hypothetical protein